MNRKFTRLVLSLSAWGILTGIAHATTYQVHLGYMQPLTGYIQHQMIDEVTHEKILLVAGDSVSVSANITVSFGYDFGGELLEIFDSSDVVLAHFKASTLLHGDEFLNFDYNSPARTVNCEFEYITPASDYLNMRLAGSAYQRMIFNSVTLNVQHASTPTPTPTQSPTPNVTALNSVPVVTIKSKRVNSTGKLLVKGTATGINEIARVVVKINGKNITAKGTSQWTLTATLKKGRNKISTVAYDTTGRKSMPIDWKVIVKNN